MLTCWSRVPGTEDGDAFVPRDGTALVDYMSPDRRAGFDKFKEQDERVPPPSLESFGLNDPDLQKLVLPRLVGHPWRTLYQPVRALQQWPDIPIAYIHCTGPRTTPSPFKMLMDEMQKNPRIRTDTIATAHFPMLTERDRTIELLDRYGG